VKPYIAQVDQSSIMKIDDVGDDPTNNTFAAEVIDLQNKLESIS